MLVSPISSVSFQYSHPLKTLYKKGKLPSVTKGFYGEDLTVKNVTLEHLLPVSKGGHTVLGNLVLANAKENNARGNDNIFKYITYETVRTYLKQFRDIVVDDFNGNDYIFKIKCTLKKLEKEV